jgi:hypothetical protein
MQERSQANRRTGTNAMPKETIPICMSKQSGDITRNKKIVTLPFTDKVEAWAKRQPDSPSR